MKKQKDAELSRMFAYAGNYHGLTVLGCVLAAVSTVLSMLPFVCIWFVIRDLIHAGGQAGRRVPRRRAAHIMHGWRFCFPYSAFYCIFWH